MLLCEKTITITLPLSIWILMSIYIYIFNNIIVNLFLSIMDGLNTQHNMLLILLELSLNFICEVTIVCFPTVISVKKLGLSVFEIIISIIVLYLLFALYSAPSIYLFVMTTDWSFLGKRHPEMPWWESSFFITIQCGAVMFISKLSVGSKK